VHNDASIDQWVYLEMWTPDRIYGGIIPSISYSLDEGKTWIFPEGGPLKTLGGAEVRWLVSHFGKATDMPTVWSFSRSGLGEDFIPPGNFTSSPGGQSRLLFGLYLPAKDTALIRFAVAIYYLRPLKITYIFGDSDIKSVEEALFKLYNYGPSVYIGGLELSAKPTSLDIVEDEAGTINALKFSIPADATFSLLFSKGDTTLDVNANNIPDIVEA